MSITRDNHYVPIWYQRGFLEPGAGQLAYRDLQPEQHTLPDGSIRPGRSRFKSSPKQCFVQRDLYTTIFGTLINDEIEKRLFGAIDTDGAPAIKAFIGEDVSAWHHHFQMLFQFIDIQKLRTPKGLDWLRTRYPRLSQNELMMEMQGIQAMHCTIWSESVREVVSAADPTAFDLHLHGQMLHMARTRTATMKISMDAEPRMKRLLEADMRRSLMSMPPEGLRAQLRKLSPELDDSGIDDVVQGIRRLQELDPLAAVQEGLLGNGQGGQLSLSRMAPNFEMALYIAQATGASIVTDSPHRWHEMQMAVARQGGSQPMGIPAFAKALSASPVGFVNDLEDFYAVASTGAFEGYGPLMRDAFNYLAELENRGPKPNWEAGIAARMKRLHGDSQKRLRKVVPTFSSGRIHGLFPVGGIQDNTVNRLLLMSSSEHHLHSVPMAFFIEPAAK
jgi:hypothetical protein